MAVLAAAMPEMLMALAIVLIIWAARALFGGLLSSFANRMPIIGTVIASVFDGIINDIEVAAADTADRWLPAILGFILGPVYWVEHLIGDGLDVLQGLGNQIAYVATVMIPLAYNTALTAARALVDRAVADLESLVNQVYNIVQGEFGQVYKTLAQVESALEHYVQAEAAALQTEITAAITAETAYVTSSIAAVETELTAAITAETAYVEAAVASSVAYTEAIAASLTGEIQAEGSAITAWVLGEVGSLTNAIDLVQTATVAVALTAAKAVEADLQNLKDECTDNLCSGLSDAASLVNGLLDAGFIAALLGYTAYCAADPAAAGHDTAAVLVPVATGAKDVVDAAVGAM